MTPFTRPALFTGLSANTAADIAAIGTSRPLACGQVLFALGDPADSLYVIERGRIALTLPIEIGGRDQDLLIEERQAGETIGWSAFVPPYQFTLKATAVVDSRVLALPRVALLDYFAAHPDAGRVVTANVTAVVGHLLQVFQAMWLREVNRSVRLHVATREGVNA